jgi:hypothetical protein
MWEPSCRKMAVNFSKMPNWFLLNIHLYFWPRKHAINKYIVTAVKSCVSCRFFMTIKIIKLEWSLIQWKGSAVLHCYMLKRLKEGLKADWRVFHSTHTHSRASPAVLKRLQTKKVSSLFFTLQLYSAVFWETVSLWPWTCNPLSGSSAWATMPGSSMLWRHIFRPLLCSRLCSREWACNAGESRHKRRKGKLYSTGKTETAGMEEAMSNCLWSRKARPRNWLHTMSEQHTVWGDTNQLPASCFLTDPTSSDHVLWFTSPLKIMF